MSLKSEVGKLKKIAFPPKKLPIKIIYDISEITDIDAAIWVLLKL